MKKINLVLFCCFSLGLHAQVLNVKQAIKELNVLLPVLNTNADDNRVKSQSSIELKRNGIISFVTNNSKSGEIYDKTEINIHHKDIDVNRLNLKSTPCCKVLEIHCLGNNFDCVEYLDRTSRVNKPIPYLLLAKEEESSLELILGLKEVLNALNKRNRNSTTHSSPKHHTIKLHDNGGVYFADISIDRHRYKAIVDSGASVVAVSSEIERQLLKDRIIKRSDYIEPAKYRIATGRIVTAKRFILPELKVGKLTVKNITCSVVKNKTPFLLGKSFLDLFSKWSIDNQKQTLILEKE